MFALHMTLLAETRLFGDEHFIVGRAMGVVAGKAVFLDRRVFPKDRRLFFCVTFVTFVINRFGIYQFFASRTMRVMAGGASHDAFSGRRGGVSHGMFGAFEHIRANIGVTGKAEITFFAFRKQLLVAAVNLVAGYAG